MLVTIQETVDFQLTFDGIPAEITIGDIISFPRNQGNGSLRMVIRRGVKRLLFSGDFGLTGYFKLPLAIIPQEIAADLAAAYGYAIEQINNTESYRVVHN